MQHAAHRILRSAAAAGMLSLAAACIVPPAGIAPRPQETDQPAPDVSFYAYDSAPGNAGAEFLSYSTTRDAYTAAFEVDQRGQVRVLSPNSPRDNSRSQAGTSYVLLPMLHSVDREYLSPSTDFSRVPFVFVLTSDTPLNLSAFGSGREWTHTVTVGARDPDSTIATVAQWVLPDAPAYGSDFAYVGPQLRPTEQEYLAQCARPVDDVHDYGYYRDLWAVFTPADQRLSTNPNWLYSPALSWSSYSLLPLAQYRAQYATNLFYAGCTGVPSAYGYGSTYAYNDFNYYSGAGLFGGYGAYGYGPYGFGYGGGYPIGYGVVVGNGAQRVVAPLRVPRTPNALGSLQVAGTPGTAAPGTAGVAATAGRPTRLAWRPFDGGRAPGEVQSLPRIGLSQRLPFVARQTDGRDGGPQPLGYAVPRGYGARTGPDMRQYGGGPSGRAVVRSEGATSAPRSAGYSPHTGGSAVSSAPASGGAGASRASSSSASSGSSGTSAASGGGSRGGKAQ